MRTFNLNLTLPKGWHELDDGQLVLYSNCSPKCFPKEQEKKIAEQPSGIKPYNQAKMRQTTKLYEKYSIVSKKITTFASKIIQGYYYG